MIFVLIYQQNANSGSWISTIVMFAVIFTIIFFLVRKFNKMESNVRKEYKRRSGSAKGCLITSAVFFSMAVIHVLIGYSKLANISDAKAYVGGGAYNYIIHSISSNSYILFAIFYAVLTGVTMLCANFVRLRAVLESLKNTKSEE